MSTHSIEQVLHFNLAVAEVIGRLDARILGRARPTGESRLLREIGSEGAEVRALRARLHLDSGYLSRLLAALEEQGLVTVSSLPEDRRVRWAELTEAGMKERAELDRLSAAVAARILDPLSESQRGKLLAAMADVERLLRRPRKSGRVRMSCPAPAKYTGTAVVLLEFAPPAVRPRRA